jgi:tartrate dehydratase beta subunit/fumarate hydratase class I family protein
MHLPINVKSPNNIIKWHMGFNSAFKGLIMKRKNGKVKNGHETGRKKNEINEQTVMMKGKTVMMKGNKKKKKESSYLCARHKDRYRSGSGGVAALAQTPHEIG